MSNKRVTLTYTVDLDDLEVEVERLHARTLNFLSSCVKTAHTPTETMLALTTVERLDELRKGLSRADHMLEDITKIIGGYLSYQLAETTDNPIVPNAPPEINELQHKLKNLQEMIAQNGLPAEEQVLPPQGD